MKSNIEKQLLGTYRPKRDGPLETNIGGETLVDIKPPLNLSERVLESWNIIIPSLCNLGIIYKQDYQTLYHAFETLQEIEKVRSLKLKLDNKSLLSKNLDKWMKLSGLENKLIMQYTNIMTMFFVSPKERMKALEVLNKKEEVVEKDIIDEFIT